MPRRVVERRTHPFIVVGLAVLVGVVSSAVQAAPIHEPIPPVTSHQFVLEPRGTAPRDQDGKIPNPATPTGAPVGIAPACTETIASGPSGSTATVNRAISAIQNTMTKPVALCLTGTFHGPIHVWGKYRAPLLTIESAPHHAPAALRLGAVQNFGAVNPNEYDGVAGAVSIVDSRGVEIRSLVITGYHAWGTSATPAGIYVETRAKGFGGIPSACFSHGDHACSDIYLINNHISDIRNWADTQSHVKRWCNNPNVDAFGIEIEAYGHGNSQSLQHVVIEGNHVDHTRTGQSETVAVNGDVRDFLVANNLIDDADNIGIDTEGWYNGTGQSRQGLISNNIVANIDTVSNHAYGVWSARFNTCEALPPNAAGIYDDGSAYIWIRDNTVANTNQGISLDTETPGRWTDHILVSGNRVWDSPGTSLHDPSYGRNPADVPGRSSAAGHAYDAFYVDAFGSGSHIYAVYAYDNVFQNSSRYYGGSVHHQGAVLDFGGHYSQVLLWDNTVVGGGPTNRHIVLVGVDNTPVRPTSTRLDCTDYRNLSAGTNFYLPGPSGPAFHSFLRWKIQNRYGWDQHSQVNRPPACPAALP